MAMAFGLIAAHPGARFARLAGNLDVHDLRCRQPGADRGRTVAELQPARRPRALPLRHDEEGDRHGWEPIPSCGPCQRPHSMLAEALNPES
jgi:hypothetical protein